ncbi:MAG: cation:proton antiporter [Tannerellaceae bacterium]|nr:cation:proton antiporter [Tannerellaceae bacterium]
MRKVLLFSFFLMTGLIISQFLPQLAGDYFGTVKTGTDTLLYICLAFIMINVGREFEMDKKRWRTYTRDYFIAMATAACPWILVCLYYIFVLLPSVYWGSQQAWEENLLLSRFAAPTSAGILFTMLAAAGLKATWVYKKIQVLAIFDDLDTIILMIPLQIMMVGMKWELLAIVVIVTALLVIGWRKMGHYNMSQYWQAILMYAILIYGITYVIYLGSKTLFLLEEGIHIEVLLPAFVLGMIMRHKHLDAPSEIRATDSISYLFMLLVGVSMPAFFGVDFAAQAEASSSIIASQPIMSWQMILLHVVVVSALSNLGKLFPMLFYRHRQWRERLALSIGMFTRGEVGAGIIFIALSYNLGGPALIISVLTIVFNLILTGIFVVWVEKLTRRAYELEQAESTN